MDDIRKKLDAARILLNRAGDPFNGTFVLVSDDEVVTDMQSGTSYVTRRMWDRLKEAIPTPLVSDHRSTDHGE